MLRRISVFLTDMSFWFWYFLIG